MEGNHLLEKLVQLLETAVGDSKQPNKVESEVNVPVVKSTNQHEQLAMFVVLEPQEEDGSTADLHGDWYDSDTIRKACHDYNRHCEQVGILHKSLASEDEVEVQESYIAPCDFYTESGDFVKKGSWLMWLHFKSESLWQKMLDGTYDSVSIDCMAEGAEII
jgi:hypothetical protein